MHPYTSPPAHNIFLSQDERSVCILDQSLLPNETRYLELSTQAEFIEAISSLRVRGAPAIGIFAAFAFYVLAARSRITDTNHLLKACALWRDALNEARPTAVNLSKMLDRMLEKAKSMASATTSELIRALKEEAFLIQGEDITMCRSISTFGLSLLSDGDGILTHCNAGPLATSQYGTALGPLILGKEQGMSFHVFCDETRPLLQGARLTTYELQNASIPCTLICDNMASLVMQEGKIDACLVGCDRVARNGDTANKIGTSTVAILAQYYKIPFYVLGPSSSLDFRCPTGADIPIEQRDESEIRDLFFKKPSALRSVPCYNPAFDVTPHTLISAIVTEKGICRPPFEVSFSRLFPKEFQEGQP